MYLHSTQYVPSSARPARLGAISSHLIRPDGATRCLDTQTPNTILDTQTPNTVLRLDTDAQHTDAERRRAPCVPASVAPALPVATRSFPRPRPRRRRSLTCSPPARLLPSSPPRLPASAPSPPSDCTVGTLPPNALCAPLPPHALCAPCSLLPSSPIAVTASGRPRAIPPPTPSPVRTACASISCAADDKCHYFPESALATQSQTPPRRPAHAPGSSSPCSHHLPARP